MDTEHEEREGPSPFAAILDTMTPEQLAAFDPRLDRDTARAAWVAACREARK